MVTTEFGHLPATAGERLHHVIGTVVARVAAMWRAAQNRRAVAKLLEWDSRALRDIGLTEGDVRSALVTPAGQDASTRLARMCHERRAAQRAIGQQQLHAQKRELPSHSMPFPDL
jgi:uncharacterized protein YjiS (DUF1127 family)